MEPALVERTELMQILMQDVAAEAGVSITTVSHVLNNTRPVAEATRQRVLKAVEELRYVQNVSARSLVQGTSRMCGLMISDIEDPCSAPLVHGFEQACRASGLELVLAMTHGAKEDAEGCVRRLIADRARGVAVMRAEVDGGLVDQMLAREMPVVLLDDAKVCRGKSSLRLDYSPGIESAVERLHALGHRDIAIMQIARHDVSAQRYRATILNALRSHDMRLTGALETKDTPAGGAAALAQLLVQKTRPTAVFCASDAIAIGAMQEAMRVGVSVPEDLSVIGTGDVAFAAYSQPSLSTIRIPYRELGRTAFAALESLLNDPARTGREFPIQTEFVARQSIGPARRSKQPA